MICSSGNFTYYLTGFNYTLHSLQCSNTGDEFSRLNREIINVSQQNCTECITKTPLKTTGCRSVRHILRIHACRIQKPLHIECLRHSRIEEMQTNDHLADGLQKHLAVYRVRASFRRHDDCQPKGILGQRTCVNLQGLSLIHI